MPWLTLEDREVTNLREALLQANVSPYASWTQRANCGGRGLCATCGVHIVSGEPEPVHWHDKAAKRFGYPRLACQITLDHDMHVAQVPKLIWGARLSE